MWLPGAETCPTLLFAWGETGGEIAHRMRVVPEPSHGAARSDVWVVREHEGRYRALRIMDVGSSIEVGPGSIAEVVERAVTAAVPVGDTISARALTRPVGLRLTLIAAAREATPEVLAAFATGFREAGGQRVGLRHLSEACLLLPSLDGDAPSESEEALLEVRRRLFDERRGAAFHGCWWLGRINALGQALPPLPGSVDDLAAVVGILVSTPPEYLPLWSQPPPGRPVHFALGAAELTVARGTLRQTLVRRQVAHLLRRNFLDSRDGVDSSRWREAARRWVTVEAAGILDSLDYTWGGARIWVGSPPAPGGQPRRKDPAEVAVDLAARYRRFLTEELPQLQARLDSSAATRFQELRKSFLWNVCRVADMENLGAALTFAREVGEDTSYQSAGDSSRTRAGAEAEQEAEGAILSAQEKLAVSMSRAHRLASGLPPEAGSSWWRRSWWPSAVSAARSAAREAQMSALEALAQAYAQRVELSVSAAFHCARDRMIGSLLESARHVHEDLAHTRQCLAAVAERFASSRIGTGLRVWCPIVSDGHLETVRRRLAAASGADLDSSPLPRSHAIQASAEELTSVLEEEAHRAFADVDTWRLGDALRASGRGPEEAAAWLRHSSSPLLGGEHDSEDAVILRGATESDTGRDLRRLLPGCTVIEGGDGSNLAVIQATRLP